MPGHDPVHDTLIELLGDDLDLLAAMADDLTVLVDRPAPAPNPELALVLMNGLSTEKGDLLATAASNVTGPAPQAAGLPKWRKERTMLPVGFLSGLGGKIAAGVSASLIGLTTAGAAGALPGPAQGAVAGVINTVTPFSITDGSDGTAGGGAQAGVQALGTDSGVKANVSTGTNDGAAEGAGQAGVTVPGGSVTVTGSGGASPTGGDASGSGQVAAGLPDLSSLPGLPDLGSLPGLDGLPVPPCVSDLLQLAPGQPLTVPTQITGEVLNCVRTVIDSVPLPAGVDQCVDSVLDYATTVVGNGGVPTGLPMFDVSTCVPVDISACMSSIFSSLPGLGGGIPFMGNLPIPWFGGGSGDFMSMIPDLEGCMPFDLDGCLSSLLNSMPGLASGTLPTGVPNLDLSNCTPA